MTASIESFSLDLNELAKKVLTIRERIRFSRIKDKLERLEIIKYVLYSKLELKCQDLTIKMEKLKKESKKNCSSDHYLSILPYKIQFFKLEPKKENFYNALLLLKRIEEEIK